MIRFDLDTSKWEQDAEEWSLIMTKMAEVKRDYFVGSVSNVIVREGIRTELTQMEWGLIPGFSHDVGYGKKYGFNARTEGSKDRGEGIENMRSFREAIQKRRCVIPVSTYFEQWDGIWWGFCPNDRPFYPLAGIYEAAHVTEHPTFAIVTTPANPLGAKYNERMPLILRQEDIQTWLDPEIRFEVVRELMVTYPDDQMRVENRGSNKRKRESES